jgi:phosphoribosyl-AMP cyclohydrolase
MKKFSREEIRVLVDQIDFSKIKGELVPIIAQDYLTNQVLMLAFGNKDALEKTLETGYMHYYSRSRKKVWKKGEISGHFQEVESVIMDCDNDSLLMKVRQIGGACHKGYYTCFYRAFKNGKFIEIGTRIFNPEEVYGK